MQWLECVAGAFEDDRDAEALAMLNGWDGRMEGGADLDARVGRPPRTLLQWACAKGAEEAVRLLIPFGADLGEQGTKALMLAAGSGSVGTLNAVLESGRCGSVNAATTSGRTALHCAAEDGLSTSVWRLLGAGADAGSVDDAGCTVLMSAASSGDAATVEAVLSTGQSGYVDYIDGDGDTALCMAAARGSAGAMGLLLAAGADITSTSEDGATVLMWAAHSGRVEAVEAALSSDRAGDVNAVDESGQTALHWANSAEVVLRLLAAGCDPGIIAHHGLTTLMVGTRQGSEEAADALLTSGRSGDVDSVDGLGRTALQLAAEAGTAGVVRRLLAAGADLEMHDDYGKTVLMAAASSRSEETLEAVLGTGHPGHTSAKDAAGIAAGAEAGLTSASGATALRSATAPSRMQDTLDDMQGSSSRGLTIDARDLQGRTALHHAATRQFGFAVRRLLAEGADASLADGRGQTPLMCAAKEHLLEAVDALLSSGMAGPVDAWSTTTPHPATALSLAALHRVRLPSCWKRLGWQVVSRLLAGGADPSTAYTALGRGSALAFRSGAIMELVRSQRGWLRRRRLVSWRTAVTAARAVPAGRRWSRRSSDDGDGGYA